MMKTHIPFLLLAGLLLLAGCIHTVQGDGNVITEIVPVTDYDEIETGGPMKIHYTQSTEAPFLEVTTDQNIYDKYDFKVVDGHKLIIRPKDGIRNRGFRLSALLENANFRPTTFVVKTNSTTLRSALIAGDSEFFIDNKLTTDELEVALAGSGTIFMQDTVQAGKIRTNIAGSATARITYIACDSFKGEIAGSGEIFVAGTANDAGFSIAGSGDVHAFDLVVNDLKGEIAGSGTIETHANNSIHVKGAGSGNIYYKGNPQDVSSSIAGSGKVKAVEE